MPDSSTRNPVAIIVGKIDSWPTRVRSSFEMKPTTPNNQLHQNFPEVAVIEGNQQVVTKPDDSLSPPLFTLFVICQHSSQLVLRLMMTARKLKQYTSFASTLRHSIHSVLRIDNRLNA
jgi:hypothetical protein